MTPRSNLAENQPHQGNSPVLRMLKSQTTPSPLDELVARKPVRRHIRDFAGILAFVLLAIAAYITYRGGSLANCGALIVAAGILLILGYSFPAALRRVWESWMLLAEYLGMAATFLLLAVVWLLLLVPTAVLLRLLGKSVMNLKFKENCPSYWNEKPADDSNYQRLERQY